MQDSTSHRTKGVLPFANSTHLYRDSTNGMFPFANGTHLFRDSTNGMFPFANGTHLFRDSTNGMLPFANGTHWVRDYGNDSMPLLRRRGRATTATGGAHTWCGINSHKLGYYGNSVIICDNLR
ncbi:MAG: hypothetical protein IJS08_18315 [Victivallales bacterium]|nr:hypothetical protein [Victivallales bacterium]